MSNLSDPELQALVEAAEAAEGEGITRGLHFDGTGPSNSHIAKANPPTILALVAEVRESRDRVRDLEGAAHAALTWLDDSEHSPNHSGEDGDPCVACDYERLYDALPSVSPLLAPPASQQRVRDLEAALGEAKETVRHLLRTAGHWGGCPMLAIWPLAQCTCIVGKARALLLEPVAGETGEVTEEGGGRVQ